MDIENYIDGRFVPSSATETVDVINPATLEVLGKTPLCSLGKGGLWGSIIRIAPSLSITREECDEVLTKLRRSLEVL